MRVFYGNDRTECACSPCRRPKPRSDRYGKLIPLSGEVPVVLINLGQENFVRTKLCGNLQSEEVQTVPAQS